MPGPSYMKQCQRILQRYVEAGEPLQVPMTRIARWGIQQHLWEPTSEDLAKLFAERLSKAARLVHHLDPQGRSVRTFAAARVEVHGEQQSLWDVSITTDREFMQVSFAQRRQGMVAVAKQLKTDVNSYNENHNPGEPIQLSLNLAPDVAELEAVEELTKPTPATAL